MKKKSLILSIASLAVVGTVLFSCGKSDVPTQSATNNSEIEVSEQMNSTDDQNQAVDSLSWIQLGNLTSHPELRKSIEEALNITTDSNGNKDGMIYINPKTLEQDNNSTLFSAMHNTKFTSAMFGTGMSSAGATEYVDVEEAEGDKTAALAAINAYFELLPDTEANTFNGSTTLTRAQAMTLFMRAITPVNESNNPTANTSFTSAVGSNIYTDYASYVDKYAYLNTSNGLDATSFNSTMTVGEFICMITNFIDEDYETFLKQNDNSENMYKSLYSTLGLTDAGDISLADAIANADQGCPSDMHKLLSLAELMQLIRDDDIMDTWDEALTKTSAISLVYDMMYKYTKECKTDQTVFRETSAEAQEDNSIIAADPTSQEALDQRTLAEEEEVYRETGMKADTWNKYAQKNGADGANGWCWIYKNGGAAGNQPTYAINMHEGSPDYGKRYEVGDYLSNGVQLYGTNEEFMQVENDNFAKHMEEAGFEHFIGEDGSVTWIIE